eukprot:TRINITY_DN1877_c1_g2_i1.p1 TRINITY_DN1877_c1_g2~~TRINITY_DN1877_c1_g2_i1.p1  ORF type:complete len:101 (-),score=20.51 TRINITY_DN1877_c1_g2_i1:396-698(-)
MEFCLDDELFEITQKRSKKKMVQENYVPAHLNSLWFLASDTQEARKYAADYHFSLGNFEAALDCSLLIIESTMCAVLFRDVADVVVLQLISSRHCVVQPC